MRKLTKPQRRALAALVHLAEGAKESGFFRREIAVYARGDGKGYTFKFMRSLQRLGYVRPASEEAATMVETGQCACGCDTWLPTVNGVVYVDGLRVVVADDERRA